MTMSLSLIAQNDYIAGTWEYRPTGTKMEIEINKGELTTDIDGYDSDRTYTKVNGFKYKSTDIENLYLEIVSSTKIITYNTKTNSQNTWHKFDGTSSKSSTKNTQSKNTKNRNLASSSSTKNESISYQKSSGQTSSSSSKMDAYKRSQVSNSSRSNNGSFLNLGVGFLSSYSGSSVIPPIGISYNRPFKDNIMIGAFFSYAQTNIDSGLGSEFDWGYRFMTFGARGTYHFDFGPDKLDPYAGLHLGYTIGSVTGDCAGDCGLNSLAWSGVLGARYHVSEKIVPFLELGYGLSAVTIGISWGL